MGFAKEYQESSNPSSAILVPRKFNMYLDQADCDLQDIAMGSEFTLFHCKNKSTGLTQVYGTGTNLHGQLAGGITSHLTDFSLIELLSDYTIKSEKGDIPMEIKKLSCGDNHCVAQMDIDVVLTWGSNEFGQIGNRKRSIQTSPLIITSLKNRKVRMVQADGKLTYALAEKEPPKESTKPQEKKA
jgi:alpha-tubulin suppressor-like RCC1 family protein